MKTAQRYHVDATAIAGIIAYEALENIEFSDYFSLTRSAGPGKVHYKASYFSEGLPNAKYVEEIGVLRRRTMSERRSLLFTDRGAITYIAAILAVDSSIAQKSRYSISCRPSILATFYTGWNINELIALFSEKRYPDALQPNSAGQWVAMNQRWLKTALREEPQPCGKRHATLYCNSTKSPRAAPLLVHLHFDTCQLQKKHIYHIY
jgi:hypothetical protein